VEFGHQKGAYIPPQARVSTDVTSALRSDFPCMDMVVAMVGSESTD
jgi:hypothetical protein